MRTMIRAAVVCAALATFAATTQPLLAQQRAVSAEARTARYLESIRANPPELMLFLRDMPKGADLHNHLSGAIYAETFIKWAAQDSMCVDMSSLALTPPPCTTTGRVAAASALQNATLYGELIDAWSMRNWSRAGQNGHDQFFRSFGKFGYAGAGRGGEARRARCVGRRGRSPAHFPTAPTRRARTPPRRGSSPPGPLRPPAVPPRFRPGRCAISPAAPPVHRRRSPGCWAGARSARRRCPSACRSLGRRRSR